MIKFAPFLLAILYALVAWRFSAWRTNRVLESRSTVLADPVLRRMAARLADALDLPAVKVRVYEIEPVNGLAAPDGRIFLTRGFLDRFRQGLVTAEEIASVIAHELGHVALGHTRRRMIDFAGQNAMFVSLAALLARAIPVVGPLVSVGLARLVTATLAARLSQADEFEADAWAAALLVKAGIGTGPQKSLLAKLGTLTGSGGRAGGPAWLLSHPPAERRIAAIESCEARWRAAGLPPPG
jgi:putative metalloprotease